MPILGPYLPQANGDSQMQGTAYSEGGALYALGLINTGCGSGRSVEGYLREALRTAQGEVVQHGAALGLGVAGVGGNNPDAIDDLKQMLFTDSAVAGEAAGFAMGLILLGTTDASNAKMLGFVYHGRQEEASETIQLLPSEKVCIP